MPNPPCSWSRSSLYCLIMWEMGWLDYFPLNYDEHYLHVGQELFQLPLDCEAQVSLEAIA